ncbi:unnamed protein product [Schistocephalus solidus]|uniref:Uncharacterized protein n=1 Tax=Schistocephalus solidus TaxID=70667 RepID=A0A183SIR9_SCHSO|nr:unnamed protein product [Schistocephalus solidus]
MYTDNPAAGYWTSACTGHLVCLQQEIPAPGAQKPSCANATHKGCASESAELRWRVTRCVRARSVVDGRLGQSATRSVEAACAWVWRRFRGKYGTSRVKCLSLLRSKPGSHLLRKCVSNQPPFRMDSVEANRSVEVEPAVETEEVVVDQSGDQCGYFQEFEPYDRLIYECSVSAAVAAFLRLGKT